MNTEIFEKVKIIVADRLNVKESEVTFEKRFKDLGADSLDAVDTIMEIEKKFDMSISDNDMEKLTTIESIVDYIEDHTK